LSFRPDSRLVSDVAASPNFEERASGHVPDLLLLHYTGMQSTLAALARLRDGNEPPVSSHYLIDEEGSILQLVPEERRAWHAGLASWAGESDINSCSIGIEIANPGHDFGYPDFPPHQIGAVIALCNRHRRAPQDSCRPRAGALRRRAGPQTGPRRKISLAAIARTGRRPLDPARADRRSAVSRRRRLRERRFRIADAACWLWLRDRRHRQFRRRDTRRCRCISAPLSYGTNRRHCRRINEDDFNKPHWIPPRTSRLSAPSLPQSKQSFARSFRRA
jgi:hypothetical protein